jgi:hypothetical protein
MTEQTQPWPVIWADQQVNCVCNREIETPGPGAPRSRDP